MIEMVRLIVSALALVSACGFKPTAGGSNSSDGGDGDGMADVFVEIDAQVGDAPALCSTWHPHDFQPCDIGSPMGEVHLTAAGSPYVYDTSVMGGELRDKAGTVLMSSPLTLMQADNTFVALLSIDKLTIDAPVTWNVIGTKPLIIASWSTITIAGDLDAGSHETEVDMATRTDASSQVGAGSLDPGTCATRAGSQGFDAASTGGSGGGGGGAFQGAGGTGAVGDMNCSSTPCPRPGGPGGMALAAEPTSYHGGCPGGGGGKAGTGASAPADQNTIATGGAGGGAIVLAARMDIHVAGTVRAGGAGGAGAPFHTAGGGGGGGAGGLIGFDGQTVEVMGTGVVAANGGGGGGSAPFTSGNAYGNLGTDGQPSLTAAPGGAAQSSGCGLGGASGSAGGTLAGTLATGNDACGGGGGGGGAGHIVVRAQTYTHGGSTVVSPSASEP